MSLPYDHGAFDIAVMALVIQYIPDPGKAMPEMTRVVRKGGTVAAYVSPGARRVIPIGHWRMQFIQSGWPSAIGREHGCGPRRR